MDYKTSIQPQQYLQLDGLLGHLSACSGLYSKETFLSLYSCIIRMIRDHHMRGFVLNRTLGDDAFDAMAVALEGLPDVSVFSLNESGSQSFELGTAKPTGFLVALTNRFCAALYWTSDTQETFRMFEGGWTFHPGDVRTMAAHLISRLDNPELTTILEETAIDRRYDDKLNLLLSSLVNGLENRNRELTLALDKVNDLNKKMVDHERLAAVGQLCSVIAHEIRNPLGLIDLYAKLIEEQLKQVDVEADKQELLVKNLAFIRQATVNLEGILTELTDYSRPLQLQQEATDIVSLVRDVCLFYEPSYVERKVKLSIPSADREGLFLNLDTGRIRQALINLLKNALEASSADSKVQVLVASRKRDRYVYIKVVDQGKGIDAQVAKKLFTPYFSTKGNGTGLGLAHSRKILQAHGGTVELLSSTPGEGATFALILPRTLETQRP